MGTRIIELYYDMVQRSLVDSTTGAKLKSGNYPRLKYREKPILNLQIVTVAGSVVSDYTGFDGTEDFTVAVDDDFDHDSTVMVKATNAAVNVAGEWWFGGVSGNADIEAGELSAVLDCNTTQYRDAIGTKGSLSNTQLEVKGYDGVSGDVIFVLRFKIFSENLVDDDGSPDPTELGSFGGVGVASIGNGVSTITVTGLSLAYTPTTVLPHVAMPTNGDLSIVPVLEQDSISTDGFTCKLTGITDSANYKLHYAYYQ